MALDPNPALVYVRNASSTATQTTTQVTYPDVLVRFLALLGVVVVSAYVAWLITPPADVLAGYFTWVFFAAIIVAAAACVFAVRALFSANVKVGVMLAFVYAGIQGAAMGFLSNLLAQQYGTGLVLNALVGTGVVFAGAVVFSTTPLGRRTGSAGRFFTAALLGYLGIALVNLVLAWSGVGDGWGIAGLGVFGVVFCLVAVALAAWSVNVDIVAIQRAVGQPAHPAAAWGLGLSLTVSVVWLYLEILRLLAVARR